MNLNNLSMNYKIILGFSTVTILTLIFQYIKNLLNPNKRLLEGQRSDMDTIISNRYGEAVLGTNNNSVGIGASGASYINDQGDKQVQLLQGLYDELGEFNHIYQERMFENLIPSQIRKTIIHLSSINVEGNQHIFPISSNDNAGLREFKNVINFKLLGAQIPYVPHNIYKSSRSGETDSNVLKYNDESYVIEEGYYTIYTLINTINNKLSASKTGVALSFNNVTKFITLNGSLTHFEETPLSKKLGLDVGGGGLKTIPDLSIHYIDIIYQQNHPRAATLTNDDGSVLKRIPLNGQPGDMIYYNTPESDYHSQELFNPDAGANLSNLNFKFKRHDGSEYDFKGLHYDLKIEITELVEPTLLNELASHMRRDKNRFFNNEGSTNLGNIDYKTNDMDNNAWQSVRDAR